MKTRPRLTRGRRVARALSPPPNQIGRDGPLLRRPRQVIAAMPRHEAPGSPFPIAGTVSYPPTPCTDALWRPGRWLRCFHTPEPCTRTGWVWVPDACHFRIFPSAALQRFPRPVWLVFAGTSVHRGTFFAAVDALMGRRAENLTSDRVWRCWGWMDLTYKNVRVSYLDLRFTVLFLRQPRPIAEPAYTDHAVRALRALGAAAGGGPDLFYLEMGLNPGTPHEPALIRSWLGPGWAGRFLVHFVKPCAATDYCGDRLELAARGRRPPALGWIEDHPESGVEYVDESHMALPFIHDQVRASRARGGLGGGSGSRCALPFIHGRGRAAVACRAR